MALYSWLYIALIARPPILYLAYSSSLYLLIVMGLIGTAFQQPQVAVGEDLPDLPDGLAAVRHLVHRDASPSLWADAEALARAMSRASTAS